MAEWTAWARERLWALSPARRAHSVRVAELARALAERHHLPADDAYGAGLAHDLAREWDGPALRREAERVGWSIGPEEQAAPVLLHGPVAAAWMAEHQIGSASAQNAVRFHTTGDPMLDALGWVVFVADGVEPGRTYPDAARLRALAYDDLDAAIRVVLESTRQYLTARGIPPHPRTLAAHQLLVGSSRRVEQR
jgi:predicted HD superfamily hydrolase involved in NAD metabolism